MRTAVVTAFLLLAACTVSVGQITLVPRGSVWKYFVSGPPPTNWHLPNFDDSAWVSDEAQLGYGDLDEATLLFSNPASAPPAMYFRRSFMVTNRAGISSATLRLLADDGAIVYVNGAVAVRRNMPLGIIGHTTPALVNREAGENSFAQYGFYSFYLRSNLNMVAVEVHQHPDGRHDASFDLELLVNIPWVPPTITITRPLDGTVFSGRDVLIETTTTAPGAHVTKVQFYTNAVLMGETSDEPYSFLWRDAPQGRYRLTAVAQGFVGSGLSPPVYVQVGAGESNRVVRGPYLQSGSPTNMVVRWRTDWSCDSVVRFGTNPAALDRAVTNSTTTIDHEINVTGLQPDTQYHYSVGTRLQPIASGPGHFFRTSPTNSRPVRLWIIGDSGTADANAAAVRDAYVDNTGLAATDLWLMLGDNAYGSGTDDEHQRAIFDLYPQLLRNTVVWPTLGNHEARDAGGNDPNLHMPYLDIFTLPKNGGSGGVASGTELYYSFDYGNIHLVSLDSYLSDRSADGPMLRWLEADLAATDKDWIIAYWHHPAYSWADHDSDRDPYQTDMREKVLPILEHYGVDLVFAGHSHVYERSFLLNGHYGQSWTLQPSMILDAGLGNPNVDGPYRKPAGGLGSGQGTVYTVCGCSGQGGEGTFERHPAIAVNYTGFGSVVLQIDGLRMDASFLRSSGAIDDRFTIDKSTPGIVRPELHITRNTNGTVVSWPTSRPAFDLEGTDTFLTALWQPVTPSPRTIGRQNFVTVETNSPMRFFQLRVRP